MMFKSNVNKKQEESFKKRETVEQFLARGGQIEKIEEGVSGKQKRTAKSNKVDAQALLDKAIGTPQEQEVINFLKSQGIEVE
jgi:hypothetical protein